MNVKYGPVCPEKGFTVGQVEHRPLWTWMWSMDLFALRRVSLLVRLNTDQSVCPEKGFTVGQVEHRPLWTCLPSEGFHFSVGQVEHRPICLPSKGFQCWSGWTQTTVDLFNLRRVSLQCWSGWTQTTVDLFNLRRVSLHCWSGWTQTTLDLTRGNVDLPPLPLLSPSVSHSCHPLVYIEKRPQASSALVVSAELDSVPAWLFPLTPAWPG